MEGAGRRCDGRTQPNLHLHLYTALHLRQIGCASIRCGCITERTPPHTTPSEPRLGLDLHLVAPPGVAVRLVGRVPGREVHRALARMGGGRRRDGQRVLCLVALGRHERTQRAHGSEQCSNLHQRAASRHRPPAKNMRGAPAALVEMAVWISHPHPRLNASASSVPRPCAHRLTSIFAANQRVALSQPTQLPATQDTSEQRDLASDSYTKYNLSAVHLGWVSWSHQGAWNGPK
jgi:hypothetical protein